MFPIQLLPQREGSVTGVPSHGAVLSERFRGRCGETSRKAGCSSWARPVWWAGKGNNRLP